MGGKRNLLNHISCFVRNVPCEIQGTRRVWYNRHLNLRLLIERGKHKLVTAEEWEKASPKRRQNMMVDTVWACRPRSRVAGRVDFRLHSAISGRRRPHSLLIAPSPINLAFESERLKAYFELLFEHLGVEDPLTRIALVGKSAGPRAADAGRGGEDQAVNKRRIARLRNQKKRFEAALG